MEALLAGDPEPTAALSSALKERGIDARVHATEGLAEALTAIERELERSHPDVAAAVGAGEEALALAITAAKAGVPVAHAAAGPGSADNSRAIATLAELDAGSDPARAADLIAAWLQGEQTRQT